MTIVLAPQHEDGLFAPRLHPLWQPPILGVWTVGDGGKMRARYPKVLARNPNLAGVHLTGYTWFRRVFSRHAWIAVGFLIFC